MKNKLVSSENLSPDQRAVRRLSKNKPAVFGMAMIGLATLFALLGYLIAPDSSPNVNEQIVEVALKNPGFKVSILQVRKNQEIVDQGIFKTMLFGQPNPYKQVPINQFVFRGDSLEVELYAGENSDSGQLNKGKSVQYHLTDIVFPLKNGQASLVNQNGFISFIDEKEERQQISVKELKSKIERNHIVNRNFYLGTDRYGRSMLSRLILGVRVSLMVGFIAVFISLTIGIFLGAIAGYFGGRTDDLIMLLINTVWSIPTLLLVFAIVLALGRGIGIIFLAVGLTMWVDVARIVRGQVLGLKEIQFVEAAQSMGFSTWRILRRHILPNILGPVMVIAAANFATAILIEAGLSYLGFGIQPPTPSWGTMLNENYGYAIGGKPFLALVPAMAIMLMVLAFNLVGNGLRDALDVKTEE